MPKLLDMESFCRDLKEVTSIKVMDKRKFHPAGLFSEQIFGPVRNYTCQCGVYYGISKSGSVCDKCNIDIVNSSERRRRFAKIALPVKVVNPIMYDFVTNVCGTHIKNHIDILMKDEKSILCKDDKGYYITLNPEIKPDVIQTWEKTEAIYELVRNFSEENHEVDKRWKIIKDNLENLLIQHVVVLPPDLRPAARSVDKNNQEVDEINKKYNHIITKRESMRNTVVNVHSDKNLYYTYYKQIQKDVNELYEHIMAKLSKKEGLLRGNILGKRVDFSGRAVISPDPTIELDECVLPYLIILELYKLPIAKKLIQYGKFKILNEAIDHVNNCYELKDESLFDICNEIIRGEVCILNRQPSLHRLSMLGFKIKMSIDDVIKIHPLVCSPYNADFDGDQMAVYIPVSDETKQEVFDKLLVSKNLTNPANEKISVSPAQDIVLGIYALTADKFPSLQEKHLYKGSEVTDGKKIFNDCLPGNYPLINEEVTKPLLIKILNDIKDKYSSEVTKKVLDRIKEIGFKYSTLYGSTMSLDAFILDDTCKNIRDEIYASGTTMDQLIKVSSKEIEDLVQSQFKYSYLVSSGARGKWDQARQIILTRGFISNFSGQILEKPIKHSLVEGLTQEEFFDSSYGCRKGLLDVAVNTGESGFISRKLVFTCVNFTLDESNEDCGTKDCLEIDIDSKDKAEMLVDRYYLENNVLSKVTLENCKSLVGRKLMFRSPIFCATEKVCCKCYGDLRKHLHSEYAGVVAAQSLGETNTQLILRVFHTSLRKNVEIADVNGSSYSIEEVYKLVKSGKDFYTFSCSPDGEIVVSKVIDAFKDRLEKQMIKVTLDNNKVVECTLDHEWMMRDGSYKEAKDLEVEDSLMPIYFGSLTDGYRTVVQNKKSKFHKNYRKDKIFKLSSKHQDSIKDKNLDYNKKVHHHHMDKNKFNDYPNNLMLINENDHLKSHIEDAINSPNRINSKIAVSESNKRRTKDSEWVKKFSEKRSQTMSKTYPIEQHIENVKNWYKDNPEMKKILPEKCRLTTARIVIDKVKELNFELNDVNYENVRKSFGSKGKHYLTFNFIKEKYPDLVSDFNVVDNHKISKIEIVNLNEYEEFYDLAVDSKYSNFSLEAGIFIHNSGVAMHSEESIDMKQADVIGDLSSISKLLHVKSKDKLHENLSDFTSKLFSIYNSSRDIHHVHIEVVVSQMMWVGNTKWRLINNRQQTIPQFYSVQTTPEKESWILGLGFSYPKKHIINGISEAGLYSGIFDDIIYGVPLR